MTTELNWYGADIRAALTAALADALGNAAEALASGLTDALAAHGPPPSAPGEAPHRVTGTLADGIHTRAAGADAWEVVASADYGIDLEFGTSTMAARPWFTPTYERMAGVLEANLATDVGQALT